MEGICKEPRRNVMGSETPVLMTPELVEPFLCLGLRVRLYDRCSRLFPFGRECRVRIGIMC